MSVRVDSLSTDVVVEAPPVGGTEDARQGTAWQEQERHSALRLRLLRDELRTSSAGHDD
ncbi:MAG TPA: hypothetical protein VGO40_10410 [Longimicrobium sp.]|jgi:hypothetical protein|nr:hypothetical protein [Longimicrobium sp.]